MKYIITLFIFLLIPLSFAETTFFDNPDDSFIMGDSLATSTTDNEITEGRHLTGGGCLTNWVCSSWSSCIDGIQTRNCTKEKAYCYADLKKKPAENQSCSTENKNNTDSGEGINNSPIGNEKGIVKTIILGILVIAAISLTLFFGYKKHRKRRYYRLGY